MFGRGNLECYRLREGITKRELARRLNTSEDAIHYWLSGRTIGRKATVERIKEFLTTIGDPR
jgi:transcriptional regulator with XRE-family HTH domain